MSVNIQRAVVCHPHPSYGGSPDNHPILAIADAIGVPALRPSLPLNGAAAALAASIDAWTETDGALLAAAADERIAAVALIAPTFRFCTADDITALRSRAIPTLVLEPARDQITATGTAARELPDARVETLDGCDHYLAGYEDAIAARVAAFTRELR